MVAVLLTRFSRSAKPSVFIPVRIFYAAIIWLFGEGAGKRSFSDWDNLCDIGLFLMILNAPLPQEICLLFL